MEFMNGRKRLKKKKNSIIVRRTVHSSVSSNKISELVYNGCIYSHQNILSITVHSVSMQCFSPIQTYKTKTQIKNATVCSI